MILRQIKEMQLEDIRQAEKKRITNEKTAKEIIESNRINALNKQKRIFAWSTSFKDAESFLLRSFSLVFM